MTKKKRIVLLDSHAILHRAYHALPDFSSSTGEPTGALYGLTSILLRMVADLKPDYLVAARDLPGKTHRHEAYEAYKGTRAKTEDALVAQLIKAPEVFEAFGIPMYCAPGFEADDCIGTIVADLRAHDGLDILIASGDMDTLQLVRSDVRVYTMRKGINDIVLYDEDMVRERYGFGSERIVDYKSLRGDPSDNIPGVKGIGEKTATELIVAFGSLEEIYTALEQDEKKLEKAGIKPRIIQLLRDQKKDAFFSKELATIRLDAPITFSLPEQEWRLADHASNVEKLCDELEFRSLRARVRSALGKKGTGEEDDRAEGDADEEGESADVADAEALRETSVALWLLQSDTTDPTLDDILTYAETKSFEKARETIFAQLKKTGRLQEVYDTIEHPLIPVIERMNSTGVAIDVAHLRALGREYEKELSAIAARIYGHAGHEFNVNSPKQLAVVLYDELKLTPERQKKTAGGARTTREEELLKLAEQHPIVGEVLGYRELQKLLSTYVEKIPALVGEDGRLHARFLQAGTTTGRMASEAPNLQNIPIKTEYGRRIREAFAAPAGRVMASIDYSQIELRLAAALSGDEKLVRIFQEGGDVHAAVAAEVFGVPPEHVDHEMRRRAKVINFGILYGMGVNALRANLGAQVSRADAAKFLDDYFREFSGLRHYVERTKAAAARQGYTETLFGRRRYFPGFKSSLPGVRAQAERMAVNAPLQGTQADLIKLAMVRADALIETRGWREKAALVLQVHDELVYELDSSIAEEATRAIRETMEHVVADERLSGVPIKAEASVGPNWGAMHKVR